MKPVKKFIKEKFNWYKFVLDVHDKEASERIVLQKQNEDPGTTATCLSNDWTKNNEDSEPTSSITPRKWVYPILRKLNICHCYTPSFFLLYKINRINTQHFDHSGFLLLGKYLILVQKEDVTCPFGTLGMCNTNEDNCLQFRIIPRYLS